MRLRLTAAYLARAWKAAVIDPAPGIRPPRPYLPARMDPGTPTRKILHFWTLQPGWKDIVVCWFDRGPNRSNRPDPVSRKRPITPLHVLCLSPLRYPHPELHRPPRHPLCDGASWARVGSPRGSLSPTKNLYDSGGRIHLTWKPLRYRDCGLVGLPRARRTLIGRCCGIDPECGSIRSRRYK
jgi:hypothetical protein